MFIASSYMVYAPTVDKHASHGFRVADILGGSSAKEMAPRKAACVVVQARISTPDAAPSVASRDLKFGMDRILSDAISTKKDSHLIQSPPPPMPCSVACPTCISRCCPLPSCRCHLVEPFAVYPYQPTPYPSLAGQHLVSYSNSLYSSPEMDTAMGTLSSSHHGHTTSGKRKRSWSRAVFSNLQRKGLEKRFQLQKYITKPDRRQLAATLGLTDAQVKVWFQNRRMKWRHSKEAREQFKDKKIEDASSGESVARNKNDHENKSSEQISSHVTVAKTTNAL